VRPRAGFAGPDFNAKRSSRVDYGCSVTMANRSKRHSSSCTYAAYCNFSDIVIYTPVLYSGGLPQEYIGIANVPEPGTLVLMVAGLFAFLALRVIFPK